MDGLPVTAMHKFSLMPLIPTVIGNSNLKGLHEKMMAEGVDYALFESGSKVGTIQKNEGEFDPFYAEGRKTISEEPFTKNTIFMNYLKNQLEIAPKYKGKVVFPTQLRKLIEDGLMENGVPIDFKTNIKDVDKRILAWDKLSEEKKLDASDRYKLVKKYENNIRLLTEIGKRTLVNDLNWKMVKEKGEMVPKGSVENLIKFVKKELNRQDLADHEINFLKVKDGKLAVDASLSLSVEKIEKLLNALVIKRLIKQQVKGEGLIQVSGALFENLNSTDRDYSNATDEELKKWGTNDLPTYYQKDDGTTAAMKVKIALQGDFLSLLDAEDLNGNRIGDIDTLNEMIRDEEWLNKGRNRDMITMIGVRIPVQGLNSMEFMEVYEFLPKEAGNIIVPPAEIVAKSGSDFDIDKLTVMMPSLSKRGENFTQMVSIDAVYDNYVRAKRASDKQHLY